MSFAVLGIGTALPEVAATQQQAFEMASQISCGDDRQRLLLRALYRKSGIEVRRSVILERTEKGVAQSFLPPPRTANDRGPTTRDRMQAYADESLPLATLAARNALEAADVAPSTIDQIVTVSCSGFFSPGLDAQLIAALALPPTLGRTHVGFMGCHGTLNGLRVANALSQLPGTRNVLLCAVELCSLHFQYGFDPQHMVANSIFADGAAAVVGAAASPKTTWVLTASGSCLLPASADAMSWEIGDHGFSMGLSAEVPALIEHTLPSWLDSWLDEQGVARGDIGSWAVHPGGVRILTAVEKALALPPEALVVSREVLREHGNMSSPTILFILKRLRRVNAPRPCVALAFGPGLVVEAALLH